MNSYPRVRGRRTHPRPKTGQRAKKRHRIRVINHRLWRFGSLRDDTVDLGFAAIPSLQFRASPSLPSPANAGDDHDHNPVTHFWKPILIR